MLLPFFQINFSQLIIQDHWIIHLLIYVFILPLSKYKALILCHIFDRYCVYKWIKHNHCLGSQYRSNHRHWNFAAEGCIMENHCNVSFFRPCRTVYGILLPQSGIELGSLVVKAWSPNHWTLREFPQPSGNQYRISWKHTPTSNIIIILIDFSKVIYWNYCFNQSIRFIWTPVLYREIF